MGAEGTRRGKKRGAESRLTNGIKAEVKLTCEVGRDRERGRGGRERKLEREIVRVFSSRSVYSCRGGSVCSCRHCHSQAGMGILWERCCMEAG